MGKLSNSADFKGLHFITKSTTVQRRVDDELTLAKKHNLYPFYVSMFVLSKSDKVESSKDFNLDSRVCVYTLRVSQGGCKDGTA